MNNEVIFNDSEVSYKLPKITATLQKNSDRFMCIFLEMEMRKYYENTHRENFIRNNKHYKHYNIIKYLDAYNLDIFTNFLEN